MAAVANCTANTAEGAACLLPYGSSCLSVSDIQTATAPGIVCGLGALMFVIYLVVNLLKNDRGNQRMIEISDAIDIGARAFLVKEYTYVAVFVAVVGALLAVQGIATNQGIMTAVAFVLGAFLSALCGWIGMRTAVKANVRTCSAAMHGLNPALRVAFRAGSVMGLVVVGLGICGLAIVTLLFSSMSADCVSNAIKNAAGFGFGASSIALFARVGGGIFTKAADVGADLVGKVEAGIPEDDPRNPATIADNVGDNVGDVAGMGADLFESYVGGMIASMTLGQTYFDVPAAGILLPFWISAWGIVCSIIGTFFVRTKEGATQGDLLKAIRTGIFSASGMVVLTTVITAVASPIPMTHNGADKTWHVVLCVVVGLLSGVAIGTATEYYTSFAYTPVKSIAKASFTGGATVIIQGLGIGMISAVWPVLIMVIAILIAYGALSTFGVAIAAVGMLATLGVTLATDAYGPVADNAGGIAEMSELPEDVRDRTDALDALGNTTAATGKGFAIGSAVLTALALMAAFQDSARIYNVNVTDPGVMAGVLIGALLPFVFASFTMLAVGNSAMAVIEEVRRQFHTIPGLMEGTGKADHKTCVSMCTQSACREMIVPGMMAVLAPVVVGLILGSKGLAGLLVGSISSGFLLAVTMANAGGAWDNAKKFVEAKGLGPDHGKGSDAHKGAVIGDTVGDPFKDTSGPALNILIKLMSVVSLVLAQAGFFPGDRMGTGDNGSSWIIGLVLVAVGAGVTWFIGRTGQKRSSRSYQMHADSDDTQSLRDSAE